MHGPQVHLVLAGEQAPGEDGTKKFRERKKADESQTEEFGERSDRGFNHARQEPLLRLTYFNLRLVFAISMIGCTTLETCLNSSRRH